MNITVREYPRTTGLTTVARMREELGLTSNAQDTRLNTLIEEVSADVVAWLDQPLIRQTVTESQVGMGRTVQMLSVTPVPRYGITEVRYAGATVSGYSVSNPDAGFVYLGNRWADTRPVNQWIDQDPAIMPGAQDYEFDYSGGYILPGDDITASGTEGAIVVDANDSSFELVGIDTTFPILTSGEQVVTTGFVTRANNGRFTVLRRTTTKIWVQSTSLVTESGTHAIVMSRTLPRDIERAVVSEVKYRYMSQRRDPSIRSESLGDWSADYGAASVTEGMESGGLLPSVARALDKYRRVE